jgi:hypothetical protein
MARSQATWVVMDTAAPAKPAAVFTVKAELSAWMERQSPEFRLRSRVWEYPAPSLLGIPCPAELRAADVLA